MFQKRLLPSDPYVFGHPDLVTKTNALEDSAFCAMTGALGQIQFLAGYSADLMDDILGLLEDLSVRIDETADRVYTIETEFHCTESDVLKASRSPMVSESSQVVRTPIDGAFSQLFGNAENHSSIVELYSASEAPPSFSIFDNDFRKCTTGTLYSNPAYFMEEWVKAEELRQKRARLHTKRTRRMKRTRRKRERLEIQTNTNDPSLETIRGGKQSPSPSFVDHDLVKTNETIPDGDGDQDYGRGYEEESAVYETITSPQEESLPTPPPPIPTQPTEPTNSPIPPISTPESTEEASVPARPPKANSGDSAVVSQLTGKEAAAVSSDGMAAVDASPHANDTKRLSRKDDQVRVIETIPRQDSPLKSTDTEETGEEQRETSATVTNDSEKGNRGFLPQKGSPVKRNRFKTAALAVIGASRNSTKSQNYTENQGGGKKATQRAEGAAAKPAHETSNSEDQIVEPEAQKLALGGSGKEFSPQLHEQSSPGKTPGPLAQSQAKSKLKGAIRAVMFAAPKRRISEGANTSRHSESRDMADPEDKNLASNGAGSKESSGRSSAASMQGRTGDSTEVEESKLAAVNADSETNKSNSSQLRMPNENLRHEVETPPSSPPQVSGDTADEKRNVDDEETVANAFTSASDFIDSLEDEDKLIMRSSLALLEGRGNETEAKVFAQNLNELYGKSKMKRASVAAESFKKRLESIDMNDDEMSDVSDRDSDDDEGAKRRSIDPMEELRRIESRSWSLGNEVDENDEKALNSQSVGQSDKGVWEEVVDPVSGRKYWANRTLNKSSWEDPREPVAAEVTIPKSTTVPSIPAPPPVPPPDFEPISVFQSPIKKPDISTPIRRPSTRKRGSILDLSQKTSLVQQKGDMSKRPSLKPLKSRRASVRRSISLQSSSNRFSMALQTSMEIDSTSSSPPSDFKAQISQGLKGLKRVERSFDPKNSAIDSSVARILANRQAVTGGETSTDEDSDDSQISFLSGDSQSVGN